MFPNLVIVVVVAAAAAVTIVSIKFLKKMCDKGVQVAPLKLRPYGAIQICLLLLLLLLSRRCVTDAELLVWWQWTTFYVVVNGTRSSAVADIPPDADER